ncbi:MAG: type II 3-dehydroquinate dehydratase [Candidatus Shikimatogenerans sp. JK-2022]|nr:type II 3-dehydroquinate dehydratase [Candidatus Shikimatogenerans bostrichidophilus]
MNTIIIINGPNINLIGIREKNIYGNININKYLNKLKKKYLKYKKLKIKIYNTNSESKIIKFLQITRNYKKKILGIIINAGAFTHTSLAISDAIKYINNENINLIEIHISNIFNRDNIRQKSLISSNATGIIIGLGIIVYELGIISLIKKKICI